MAGRFTPREVKIVARVAARAKMTPSQYVRASVLLNAVMDGDAEAMAVVGGYAAQAMMGSVQRMLREGKLSLEPA
jgi:hypothetical protein